MPQPFDDLPEFATVLTEIAEQRRNAGISIAVRAVHKVLNPKVLAPRLAAGDFLGVQKDLVRVNVKVGRAFADAGVQTFTADEEQLFARVMVATYTRRAHDLPALLLVTAGSVHQYLTNGVPRT